MRFIEHSLIELLPSLTSTPCVSVQRHEVVANAASMLIHQLESFTDSLVVDKRTNPIGMLGGKEIIENLLQNPTSKLFDETIVEEIMNQNLKKVTEKTKLRELLECWIQTRRAFAIIANKNFCYSALSARKLFEIILDCKTEISISDLPKKEIVRFKKDASVSEIIHLMLKHNTRKLLYENSSRFVSDRKIIQMIAKNMNYLRGITNFLDLTLDPANLDEAKVILDDLKISELAKIMSDMQHPYVIFQDQVVTPWDMCMSLLTDKLELYVKVKP